MVWARWELVVKIIVVQETKGLFLGLVEEIHCAIISEILQGILIEVGRDHIVRFVKRVLLELIKPRVVEKGSLFVEI